MRKIITAISFLFLLSPILSKSQTCLIFPVTVTKTDVTCSGSADGSIFIGNLPTNFTNDQFIIEVENLGGEIIYSSSTVGFGASSLNIPRLQPGLYQFKIDQYERSVVNGQFVPTKLICGKTGSPQILTPGCDIAFQQLSFNTNPCDNDFGNASAKITGTFCSSFPETYRIINGVRDITRNVFSIGSNYSPNTTYTDNQLNGLKPGDTVQFQLLNGDYLAIPNANIENSTCNIFSPKYFMPCDLSIDSVNISPNTAQLHRLTGKVSSDYLCRFGPGYNFFIEARDSNNTPYTQGSILQDGSFSFNIPSAFTTIKLIWKMSDRCQTEKMISVPNSWTGAVSTAWENAGNWSQNAVPDATKDVFIQNFSGGTPTININSDVQIKSLELSQGVNLILKSGKKLLLTE